MYLAKDPTPLQPIYLEYVRDLQSAAPSLIPYIAPINENIINNDYYSAIKNADRLVKKEEEFFRQTLNLAAFLRLMFYLRLPSKMSQ